MAGKLKKTLLFPSSVGVPWASDLTKNRAGCYYFLPVVYWFHTEPRLAIAYCNLVFDFCMTDEPDSCISLCKFALIS